MREATYDEDTDTWKRPWWANTQDDNNYPYRQLPFNLSLGFDWSVLMVGVKRETYTSEWYWRQKNYKQTWWTFQLGPLWVMHESYRDLP